MSFVKKLMLGVGVAAALTFPNVASAQWKPVKPIHLVVGFGAGGGTDVVARAIASAAKPFFPVPIVVVNRPGAAGTIAAKVVAKSKPDGYTLLVGGGSESTSVPVYRDVGYDPKTDFKPIIRIARLRIMLAVSADSPWKTLDGFIKDAKANPGKYSFASTGNGSLYHSTMLVLSKAAGINLKHVPYQSGPQEIAALLGDHVDIAPMSPDEAKAQYKADRLRLLAVASKEPYGPWKDIPTLKSLGYDVMIENMKGLVGPSGTPQDIVEYLQNHFKKAMASDKFKQVAQKAGLEVSYESGKDFAASMQTMRDAVADALKKK